MSNDPLIKHWLLALSLLMLFLFSSCSVFNPTPAVHTLGEAIQGMYTVYYSISQGEEIGRESTEIGELYIHDGEYVFTPTEGITIPESAIDRLYFVSEPKGNYTLDYTKPFNEDTILEDLVDHEILVTINFQGKSPSKGLDSTFFIRNDKERRFLYFHSMVSEFQLWGVSKSWDD